jgi:nucleotide-binding universal stress UspA family protein
MFGKLLVGFDGSHHSQRALQAAVEIAERFHSNVTVAIVRPEGSDEVDPLLASLVPFGDDSRTVAGMIDEARERALAHGVPSFRTVDLHGSVADALLSFLEEEHQDLVIVGSRGLTPGRRILMGSVSSSLVNDAPCPVLVVRPPRAHRGHAERAGSSPGRSP